MTSSWIFFKFVFPFPPSTPQQMPNASLACHVSYHDNSFLQKIASECFPMTSVIKLCAELTKVLESEKEFMISKKHLDG